MNTQPSTEEQFFAAYDQMKSDLAHARQEIILISGQLRDANSENEKLAYKCDFLISENAKIATSRDLYQRVAARVAGKLDGALDAWIAMAEGMKDEIRDAAFTKVPTAPVPAATPYATTTAIIETAFVEENDGAEIIGRKFGAGFNTEIPRAAASRG